MAIAACKSSKNFREVCPLTPQESFLFLNLLQIYSAGKNALEKMSKFNALVPEKISGYAPDMKHFQRAYSRSFLGVNV